MSARMPFFFNYLLRAVEAYVKTETIQNLTQRGYSHAPFQRTAEHNPFIVAFVLVLSFHAPVFSKFVQWA